MFCKQKLDGSFRTTVKLHLTTDLTLQCDFEAMIKIIIINVINDVTIIMMTTPTTTTTSTTTTTTVAVNLANDSSKFCSKCPAAIGKKVSNFGQDGATNFDRKEPNPTKFPKFKTSQ